MSSACCLTTLAKLFPSIPLFYSNAQNFVNNPVNDYNIFSTSKTSQEFAKAFQSKKAVQDYVFTDGTADNSVERRFAEDLDTADEVIVYAKLPADPKAFISRPLSVIIRRIGRLRSSAAP
jgi:restriction endonuclease